ncbi:MAG: adenine phosphoribosyltransferase [Anaerolineaceae bacterium]|nr:adenine phosphoribosyltransferase [Anaerolineaceae bacterium]MBN2677503.1 adenine phosphoribosyltransferase [Anaerolineaceae bacterium]
MSPNPETFPITLAGVQRELRLFEVKPGLKIAILNILGDTELVEACAKALIEKLSAVEFDLLVTAESKSIPLVHSMAVHAGKPYVILRKSYKVYMGAAQRVETLSITTGAPQTLIMDEKDGQVVKGKRVVIVDDVISTGSTLEGMRKLMAAAGAEVVAEAAICTEGDNAEWNKIIHLGELPLFCD